MNIFKIKHFYSYSGRDKWLQTPMGFTEVWNHIKILQNITWDIDSSHNWTEGDTVFIMSKFFGAQIINPTETQKQDCFVIDLYENWECGYIDNNEEIISRSETAAIIKKYNIYRPGLYSAMLARFLEQHAFGEGDCGAWESIFMNNTVWEVLFQEGVYNREKFIAEQNTRAEYLHKCNLEKQRRSRNINSNY